LNGGITLIFITGMPHVMPLPFYFIEENPEAMGLSAALLAKKITPFLDRQDTRSYDLISCNLKFRQRAQ
jgi:hypothetical protein